MNTRRNKMPALDFGSSSEGSEPEAWESNAMKLSKQNEEKEMAEQKKRDEEEAARNREKIRKRERDKFTTGAPELSETAKARLDEKRRYEQNIVAASNMLRDDDSSSDVDGKPTKKSNTGNKNKGQGNLRDYTLEDDFMGGEATKDLSSGSKSIEEMDPVSIEQFDTFANAIVKKLVSTYKNDNDVLYMHCLKRIVEGALSPLYHEDAKELSDVCARISAEMYRKEAEKKKKKGKAQKGGSHATGKSQVYVGGRDAKYQKVDDDYDDFI